MIVVIGAMSLRGDEPSGLAARTAAAAAKEGSRVELISKVGDDPTGDALLLALARAGVGHVAVLRDTAFPTERSPELDDVALDTGPGSPRDRRPTLDAADVGLALRYLGDYRVAVVVNPSPDVLAEAIAATRWMGARLAVVLESESAPPKGLAGDAVVIEADPDQPDATGLADVLGRYAAALDRGEEAPATFAELEAAVPASPDD